MMRWVDDDAQLQFMMLEKEMCLVNENLKTGRNVEELFLRKTALNNKAFGYQIS